MFRTDFTPRAGMYSMVILAATLLLVSAAQAQTVNVSVCGTVTAYAAPSLVPGLIVIGGQTIPIAPGAGLTGSGLIAVGSDLCLTGSLNLIGELQTGTITANATTTLNVCGTVTAYTAATALLPGGITIGGQTLPIAAGTDINASGLVNVGANLCVNATLNGLGQIVPPTTVTTNATTFVSVCGVVSAYTAATASAPGSITIGGQTFPIAANTTLNGAALINVGANLCLNGTLNALGQLVVPTSVTANATTSVSVCGVVSAYTAATATAPGSIAIGGQTFPIAAGTIIEGSSLISVGASVCLSGTVNATGELVAPTSITANTTTTVSVCGVVAAYTAATASTPGSVTIGGNTFSIAAGTTITGSNLISVGTNVCLNGTLNALGQLIVPSSVTLDANSSVSVCGIVSAYTAATASTPGAITIGGQNFSIAAGTSIAGSGVIAVGANLCLNGTLGAAGQLIPPTSVTVNVGTSITACGIVTAYTAPSAVTFGSITIGGQTLSIAPGTELTGAGLIQIGANLCLSGTSAGGAQIGSGAITANPNAPPTTIAINVCGVVSAFVPATGSAPGSLTIAGQTFAIAPGTFFGSEVQVGASLCFNLPIATGPGGGQITNPGSGPVPSTPANEIIFPVVAHLTGVGGAQWRTDVRVANLRSAPATVTFEWYPFSPAGRPGPAQTSQVIVNPGVQGTFNRVLESLFNTEGGGSLRLVSASFELAAALRLYHDTDDGPCEGTFGMFEKGLRRTESVSRGALLVLGHKPSEFTHIRTNVGYFNASPAPVQITFRVHATDGRVLGTRSMTLPSFANDQRSIFDVVGSVPVPDREQQDLYMTFEAQGGLPFVYGSAVYNSTNDGLFVIPWQY